MVKIVHPNLLNMREKVNCRCVIFARESFDREGLLDESICGDEVNLDGSMKY